ncbi:MAG TPA: diadenylate cyclase CdaA [Pseudobdellovibrionaceae bacterium]|nr:diadenylate cyclase CdaA [Pseudobdellovibrionaceae bacterium]
MMNYFFENLNSIFKNVGFLDLFDIFLVWLVIYRLLLLIKKTGTLQMLSGLGILALGFITSISFELVTFHWILEKFFSHLFLIVVILFQAEFRRALAHIGTNPFFFGTSNIQETHLIEELSKTMISLAQKGYGALIVIEREIAVDYHIEMGVEIDSKISTQILESIFHPSSPMHDGAILLRSGRLVQAGCFLPLTKNPVIDKNLGTRHRAALGLSEETDAVILVVSEESKSVSIVHGGQLYPNLTLGDIRRRLYEILEVKYRPTPNESGLKT